MSGDPPTVGIGYYGGEILAYQTYMSYREEPDPQVAISSIEAVVQGYVMTEAITQFTEFIAHSESHVHFELGEHAARIHQLEQAMQEQ